MQLPLQTAATTTTTTSTTLQLHYDYNYTTTTTSTTLHYTRLQLQLQLQLQLPLHYNYNYHYNYNCNYIALTLHPLSWVRWPLQPLQKSQPTFGPSMDSLCHPCITTTHLSFSFLSLKLPPPPCAVLRVKIDMYWYVLYVWPPPWTQPCDSFKTHYFIVTGGGITVYIYMYVYIYIYWLTKVALLELPTVMFGFFFCTPFPLRILAWSFVVPLSNFHPPKALKSYKIKRGW